MVHQRLANAHSLILRQHADGTKIQNGQNGVRGPDLGPAADDMSHYSMVQLRHQAQPGDAVPLPQLVDHPVLVWTSDPALFDPSRIGKGSPGDLLHSAEVLFTFITDQKIHGFTSFTWRSRRESGNTVRIVQKSKIKGALQGATPTLPAYPATAGRRYAAWPAAGACSAAQTG